MNSVASYFLRCCWYATSLQPQGFLLRYTMIRGTLTSGAEEIYLKLSPNSKRSRSHFMICLLFSQYVDRSDLASYSSASRILLRRHVRSINRVQFLPKNEQKNCTGDRIWKWHWRTECKELIDLGEKRCFSPVGLPLFREQNARTAAPDHTEVLHMQLHHILHTKVITKRHNGDHSDKISKESPTTIPNLHTCANKRPKKQGLPTIFLAIVREFVGSGWHVGNTCFLVFVAFSLNKYLIEKIWIIFHSLYPQNCNLLQFRSQLENFQENFQNFVKKNYLWLNSVTEKFWRNFKKILNFDKIWPTLRAHLIRFLFKTGVCAERASNAHVEYSAL